MNKQCSIIIRCDGSKKVGLGHVIRCLALADQLSIMNSFNIYFAMVDNSLGKIMVEEKGYPIFEAYEFKDRQDQCRWLTKIIKQTAAKALILDVRDDFSSESVRMISEYGVLIVTIDDPSARRLQADLAFYPPVPQVYQMDWTGYDGKLYIGWEWVLLRNEFALPRKRVIHKVPKILITMGGSDPFNLTCLALRVLNHVNESFRVAIILGQGFSNYENLEGIISAAKYHIEVEQEVTDMPGIMSKADFALASFGMTAYELAAMGIPGIYFSITEDHALSATAFEEAGIGINLGWYKNISLKKASNRIERLIIDLNKRIEMSTKAFQLVDGQGARRIARVLADCLLT